MPGIQYNGLRGEFLRTRQKHERPAFAVEPMMKLLPDDSLKLLSVLVTLDSIPAGAAPGSIASPSTRFLGRRKVGRRNFSLLGNSITGHSGGSSTYIFPAIFSCPLSLCFAVSSGEYLFTFHFTRWSPCRKHLQGSASKRTVCLS